MSHSIGLNYKVSDTVPAKAEYEYVKIPSAQGGTKVLQSTATSTSAIYAGVDVTF